MVFFLEKQNYLTNFVKHLSDILLVKLLHAIKVKENSNMLKIKIDVKRGEIVKLEHFK